MKSRTGLMSLLVAALIAPAIAQNAGKQVTAFVNVNVIPMDRERVLKDQTVVVRDGRIAELGPANKVKIPAGAARVDGRGKFLIRSEERRVGKECRAQWTEDLEKKEGEIEEES